MSTRESNLGYIRRTIKPALGSTQVRKVRGPLLDPLYARLMRCGNLACTGKPFTEHRNIPDLRPDPADSRLEWEQAADRVRAAIRSGQLASGDTLPSVPDLARLQGLKPGTVRHAFLALAEEGLVHIRHGRTTTIAGEPAADEPGPRLQITRPRPGHDCKLSGCRPHVCKPMAKSTIRGIHSILSGAFEAAMRWEWIDRNQDSAGGASKVDVDKLANPDGVDLSAWAGSSSGLLDRTDVDEIAAAIQPGSVAAVIVYENRWVLSLVRHLATPRRALHRRRRDISQRRSRRP